MNLSSVLYGTFLPPNVRCAVHRSDAKGCAQIMAVLPRGERHPRSLTDRPPVGGDRGTSKWVAPGRAAPRVIAGQMLHGLQEVVEPALDGACSLVAGGLRLESLLEAEDNRLPDVARNPRRGLLLPGVWPATTETLSSIPSLMALHHILMPDTAKATAGLPQKPVPAGARYFRVVGDSSNEL